MFADKESFKQAYLEKYAEIEGKTLDEGNTWNKYYVLVMLLKEKISLCRALTNEAYRTESEKQVYYFSMEFLIGKLTPYYMVNMEIDGLVREGLAELNIDLDQLLALESDAGLGNGGLGRLAACLLDSMSFMGMQGHGNGIRYKYGLFEQKIINGSQSEIADNWLKNGYPWEVRKPDKAIVVRFGGKVRIEIHQGKLCFIHEGYEPILAVPYDVPVLSFRNPFYINQLRLWSAEPLDTGLDLGTFNRGEWSKSISNKSEIEAISSILYPEDSSMIGKELRLKQEYFFVAAGIGSIIKSHKKRKLPIQDLPRCVAIHINDTHPALCIPELMRILIDDEGLGWEEAWEICQGSVTYTNHTIMPEALETWSVGMVQNLFPRICMIIEEIDRRYKLSFDRYYPYPFELAEQTGIIKSGHIHMANLAVIGSHAVNGVAKIHTDILKSHVFKSFQNLFPRKIENITNGINHRRFLLSANPGLSGLITEAIGPTWKKKAFELEKLLMFQNDSSFLDKLGQIKYQNKVRLAKVVKETQSVVLDPHSLFDVQVKRIHAYKRQLLNVLKIMELFNWLRANPGLPIQPQTFIFAGKAAPGYYYAKTMIRLINALAAEISKEPLVREKIKVVFLENFSVTLGEYVYPAADISEQISTASKEASGTGNMKFMMNGALTLGTLDGANVEILEAVGHDHIAIFGLTADEVFNYSRNGGYKSWNEYHSNPGIKKLLDQLLEGMFFDCGDDFRSIYDSLLLYNDEFYVLKDFVPYTMAYNELISAYAKKNKWNSASLVNIARSGRFSSDRTVQEYAKKIWHLNYRSLR